MVVGSRRSFQTKYLVSRKNRALPKFLYVIFCITLLVLSNYNIHKFQYSLRASNLNGVFDT